MNYIFLHFNRAALGQDKTYNLKLSTLVCILYNILNAVLKYLPDFDTNTFISRICIEKIVKCAVLETIEVQSVFQLTLNWKRQLSYMKLFLVLLDTLPSTKHCNSGAFKIQQAWKMEIVKKVKLKHGGNSLQFLRIEQ